MANADHTALTSAARAFLFSVGLGLMVAGCSSGGDSQGAAAIVVENQGGDLEGNLEIAPVRFETFGPEVVGIEPVGGTVTCSPPAGSSFACDVSEAISAELAAGRDQAQFRVRFERVSDPDGEADLAMFFSTDSNTNEPGIFRLELR